MLSLCKCNRCCKGTNSKTFPSYTLFSTIICILADVNEEKRILTPFRTITLGWSLWGILQYWKTLLKDCDDCSGLRTTTGHNTFSWWLKDRLDLTQFFGRGHSIVYLNIGLMSLLMHLLTWLEVWMVCDKLFTAGLTGYYTICKTHKSPLL